MKTYNIIKGIASLALSFFLAGTADAAIWNLDKTQLAKPGEQDTLRVVLENNTFNFSSFQVDIQLPEGLILTGNPIPDPTMMSGQALSWEAQGTNAYRCVVYSFNNEEMLEPQGTLFSIPVRLTPTFQEGTVSITAGLLANKKSETMEVTDYTETVKAEVEKQDIVVNVSGLEQKVDANTPASLTYTTVPSGLTLTTEYYTDEACTNGIEQTSLTQEGTYYVKLSFPGDETYNSFEGIYTLVLTTKKDIGEDAIDPPTASELVEGQLLSTSLLTGGSATDTDGNLPIPGEFVWTNGNTVVSESGKYSATFIPQNQTYYNTQEVEVQVDVKATYFIAALSSAGGSVKVVGQTRDSLYVEGQALTLEAIPDANYQFVSWSANGTEVTSGARNEITAKEDVVYLATFEPIEHAITLVTEGSGSLSVVNNGISVNSGASVQQGSMLQVTTTPNAGWQLSELTLNGDSLKGNQVKVVEPSTIQAVFTQKPVDMYTVTAGTAENGRLLIYKADGSLIPSGSSVPVNTQIRVVALPNAGYQTDYISYEGTEPLDQNDLHVVKGNVEITATFGVQQYTIATQALNSDNSQTTAAGSITVDKTSAYYGETVKVTGINAQEGANLLYILANGKEVQEGEEIPVTGDMMITAVFDHRVKIEKQYIMWPHQEYYYNGVSRNFVPFASQTYAGFSFDVSYQRTEDGNGNLIENGPIVERAVDAGKYNVILHRDEDGLYYEFNETYNDGLIINQSTIAVTEAPEISDDPMHNPQYANPKTRPGGDKVVIDYEDYNVYPHLRTYYIDPNPWYSDVVNNYEGITFYHPVSGRDEHGNEIRSVSFEWYSITYFRSAEEVHGGLRVSNGGLPYEMKDGKIEIYEGTPVTFEAVPAEGYKFVKWKDGETKNPRTIQVLDETINDKLIPEFAAKSSSINVALTSTSSVYTGAPQTVSLTGEESIISTCQVTFFSDEACTQPAILRNAGTYYVRVYRPADADYKEDTKVLTYTITQATPVITAPTASEVLAGDKLSSSELMGGHAGIVAGSFAWTNPDEVVTATGEYEVTFTPADPNYASAKVMVKVTAQGVSGEEENPDDPKPGTDDPDTPTNIEAVEAQTILTGENQTILIRPAQPMTVSIINMTGSMLYHGDITDVTSIPVGNAGVYIVKMQAGEEESVRKLQVK